MKPVRWAWAGLWVLSGCVGSVGDSPVVSEPLNLQLTASAMPLAAAAGFADQRGGGVFASDKAEPVRLRIDGSQAALENHPENREPPGRVRRVWPIGPDSAWVVADNGIYVARAGFLYELRLGQAIAPGDFVAAAVGGDERTFVALESGLFRLDAGELSELRVGGKSLTGVGALAVAAAPDGSTAVWFTQAGKLRYAKQVARARYEISDAGLDEHVVALAGLSPAPNAFGELWVLTEHALLRHSPERGFETLQPESPGRVLLAAGRFMWLQTANTLYRYAADGARWGRITGDHAHDSLLAVDASGSAWLQNAAGAYALSDKATPRVLGLFEASSVYLPDVQVSARVLSADTPLGVTFTLDDGERIERKLEQARSPASESGSLDFSLGGFDAAGSEQTYSFAGLGAGLHTLRVEARHAGGVTERELHFDLRNAMAEALSFARDIQPIFTARCAKCHLSGPGHMLGSYEVWHEERQKIVSAVVELRMPADGPLDPAQIQLIQRWAAAGGAP